MTAIICISFLFTVVPLAELGKTNEKATAEINKASEELNRTMEKANKEMQHSLQNILKP